MKVIDLFCGCGGFSEGFRQAGFEVIFGIDNNKNACKTFEHNFPNAEVVCDDILQFEDFPKADVILGSPPVQNLVKAT